MVTHLIGATIETDGATGAIKTSRCVEVGELICKDISYALRREDGDDIWLEMDLIPLHLIERKVQVEGVRYNRNLMTVAAITLA